MPLSALIDPKPNDYQEAWHSAAYLDAALMEAAGVGVGDILRIKTVRERSALARLAGPHPEGLARTIRIDRFTRQSLKVYPHEEVSIERADLQSATRVILVPGMDISMLDLAELNAQLKALLSHDQTPLCEGTLLYIKPPGALSGITYEVHNVTEGEGLCTEDTVLLLHLDSDHSHDHDEDGSHSHRSRAETVLDTTYEDVGGLGEQIREIREFVELPLLFPQVYSQLGLHPPRGVIFHGAPGTGKTLLARSIANEVNAQFQYINGPEIMGLYAGQAEESLRKMFNEAILNPPSIIFVDELDAIAPRRGTTGTFSDARAVAQLLSLMDGLNRAESVMVIGTTNRIDAIDPALRRAGRFDREVYFPSPSSEAREEIIRVHTREMPMSDDAIEALPDIARQAYGYVGADVMELAREAGLNALRRASQRFIDNPSLASYPASEDLVVTGEDFKGALKRVRPASLRGSLISFPNVSWDDIGGLGPTKQRLRDLIEKPLQHPETFARLGLSTTVGILLYGPPGTGKTLLAKAIARECGINFISIQGPELLSQWLGESEETVRDIFNVARRAAPCIVFFDQLDAVAAQRVAGEYEGTRAPQRVVSQLLSELDGMEERSQVMVIGATNKVSMLDQSVIRPGRLGVHLYIGLPEEDERREIFRIHIGSTLLVEDLTLDRLLDHFAPITEGFSGADIAFLCQQAKFEAISGSDFEGECRLALEHLQRALEEIGKIQLKEH